MACSKLKSSWFNECPLVQDNSRTLQLSQRRLVYKCLSANTTPYDILDTSPRTTRIFDPITKLELFKRETVDLTFFDGVDKLEKDDFPVRGDCGEWQGDMKIKGYSQQYTYTYGIHGSTVDCLSETLVLEYLNCEFFIGRVDGKPSCCMCINYPNGKYFFSFNIECYPILRKYRNENGIDCGFGPSVNLYTINYIFAELPKKRENFLDLDWIPNGLDMSDNNIFLSISTGITVDLEGLNFRTIHDFACHMIMLTNQYFSGNKIKVGNKLIDDYLSKNRTRLMSISMGILTKACRNKPKWLESMLQFATENHYQYECCAHFLIAQGYNLNPKPHFNSIFYKSYKTAHQFKRLVVSSRRDNGNGNKKPKPFNVPSCMKK